MVVRIAWMVAIVFLFLMGCGSTTPADKKTEEVSENEEFTQYAEGYEEDSFGGAFRSDLEGMAPLTEIPKPQGIWEDLLLLKFDISYSDEVGDVVFKPLYTKRIKQHEGQIVEVEGFIIPHEVAKDAVSGADKKKNMFMFSAFPIASCFFCGGAGAESVLEAFPKQKIGYTTEKIKLRGRLKFTTDYLRMPYILEQAELVE